MQRIPVDYFEGDSVDFELYDDAGAIAAPLRSLSLGSHTLGSASVPAQAIERQRSPNEAPSAASMGELRAQLAESQAASDASMFA